MKRLIKESGIRDINLLAKRYKKAKIYFHQDLDGVTTAIAMKNYLEQNGINVVDAEIIQYGDKEFGIKKPEGSGEVMPVLVDFAHGKPMFVIHTDHHDSQAGVEKDTATNFKSSRSNVETISQSISPKEIFTSEDIHLISTVDSANFAVNDITPEMVMNYLFKYDKNESLKRNKMLMGLVTNKLLLAFKNKPKFLERLVLEAKPSLLSILNLIKKIIKEKGYANIDDLVKNQEDYVSKMKNYKNLDVQGNVIVQYGGGSMVKSGSYDRYTPFRNNPDADFIVMAWPKGLVQSSCNPYKKERALKGVDLGEIKDEVLDVFKNELTSQKITFGTLKRLSEMGTEYGSVGFTFKDMMAIYGNSPSFKIQGDYGSLRDILSNISSRLYRSLSEKQRMLLDKVSVNGLDVIKANSGGHKCITNISGINFLYSGKKQEGDRKYVDLLKDIQKTFVDILNKKIGTPANLKESKESYKKGVESLLKNHIKGGKTLSEKEWDYIMEKLDCVVDNRGQWDHPEKCTMIESNSITMKNVPYPLLGIDDTGHTKLMLPEKTYKFPGNNVFEIPLKGKHKTLGIELLKNLSNY
jgi:hypothetical protein